MSVLTFLLHMSSLSLIGVVIIGILRVHDKIVALTFGTDLMFYFGLNGLYNIMKLCGARGARGGWPQHSFRY